MGARAITTGIDPSFISKFGEKIMKIFEHNHKYVTDINTTCAKCLVFLFICQASVHHNVLVTCGAKFVCIAARFT